MVMLSASGHVGLWVCCVDSAVLGGGGGYGHLRAASLLLFAEHERLVPSSALNFKINEMLCLKSKQRLKYYLPQLKEPCWQNQFQQKKRKWFNS